MCSIIGWDGPFDEGVARRLFYESRIRGLHAFGFSTLSNNEITTRKYHKYNGFVEAVCRLKPSKFIAHFRYSTSGDFKELMNNQPIAIGTSDAMAFNGVIDMRTRPEMEKEYGIRMETDNDGEIVLRKFIEGDRNDLEAFIKSHGTFAGLFITNGGQIYALKNERRPLYRHQSKDRTIIASTRSILERSGLAENIERVPNNSLIEIGAAL